MKKYFLGLIMFIFALSLGMGVSIAAVLNVPEDYTTIQNAIDAAEDGDTISISPGTYNESIVVRDNITIEGNGLGTLTQTSTGDDVILDGEGDRGNGITIDSNENVVIRNLNITNYHDHGIYILNSSSISIYDCYIHDNNQTENEHDRNGAGIYAIRSEDLIIENSIIENNNVYRSFCYGAAALFDFDCSFLMKNCLITGNGSGSTYSGTLSAIYSANGSTGSIVNCTIDSNDCGGLNTSYVYIENCIISNNSYGILSGSSTYNLYNNLYNNNGNNYNSGDQTGVNGNISEDAIFVTGLLGGDYYLSQIEAGQDQDSPCVDVGSNTSAYFGLDTYTTRTDEEYDTDIVDMGYHYPVVCTAEYLAIKNNGEPLDINILCRFRDEILAKSDKYRNLIKDYYTFSPEAITIFRNNPRLIPHAFCLLKIAIPKADALLKKGINNIDNWCIKKILSDREIRKFLVFIKKLRTKASTPLKNKLNKIYSMLLKDICD